MAYNREQDKIRCKTPKYLAGRKKRYEDRKKLQLCVYCGNEDVVAIGKKPMCYLCYFKQLAGTYLNSRTRWQELRDLWERQKAICPYTGQILQLGVDASIDHILPRSRYPELKYDIKNLEWVSLRVNFMKRDLLKDEFIALCKRIASNTE